MKGKISVRVRNNKNEYEFTLMRNITILSGDSGTGKSTLYRMVSDYSRVAVIADGAAFGAEIEELAERQKKSNGLLVLYLPESFEWLVIRSGVVGSASLPEMEHPEDYADSGEYFSWERYFTALLTRLSGTEEYRHYRKDKLASFYLQESSVQKIKTEIEGIDF